VIDVDGTAHPETNPSDIEDNNVSPRPPQKWEQRRPYFATVLVAPDAIISGAAPEIFSAIRTAGFELRAARVLTMSSDVARGLYPDLTYDPLRWAPPEIQGSWSSLDQIYAEAPALLVFVEHSEPKACQIAAGIKGYRRPELAIGGTIRSIGDAENVMLNLVHVSDDQEAMLREASLLIGSDEVNGFITALLEDDTQRCAILSLESALLGLPRMGSRGSISFPVIALRIRMRIVQVVAARAPRGGTGPILTGLSEALHLMEKLARDLDEAANMYGRMSIAIRASDSIHNAITKALKKSERQWAIPLMAGETAIHALHDVRQPRRPQDVRAMTKYGVYISRLEAGLIDVHHYAFRDNAELLEAYPVDGANIALR